MPGCNIIVDSCSYFRLAKSIQPLLKTPFGKGNYCLGVIEELDKEYEKSPTLKRKFFWVNEREYADNRKKCFNLTLHQRTAINHAFYFIRETARENHLGISEVDTFLLRIKYIPLCQLTYSLYLPLGDFQFIYQFD